MTYTCWNCGQEFRVTSEKDCQDYLKIIWHLETHNTESRKKINGLLQLLKEGEQE